MKTREPVVMARRRLVLGGKTYLPGEWIPADAWSKVPFAKRDILRGNGYTEETAVPPVIEASGD